MKRGGVTHPKGFSAAGLSAGIKESGKNDVALLISDTSCVAAGCFTTNQCKSYSLLWTQKQIARPVRAVLVNSGNANTCNGAESRRLTECLMKDAGTVLGVPASAVLFASTGIIGIPFPYEKIRAAVGRLRDAARPEGHEEAARGIMTTDTVMKEVAVATGVAGRSKEVVIGGMAKGAGMINPTMATMLAFLTTDAVIERGALQAALKDAVGDSFNMITVDDDQSTNDTVVCLANGHAGNPAIKQGTGAYRQFADALKEACTTLAVMIAGDGEGATKKIEVRITGARSVKDARRAAKRVAGSNLVKSAIAGAWPNWGRILAAVGSTNARMDVEKVRVVLCGSEVYRGEPVVHESGQVRNLLKGKDILLEVDLGTGSSSATAWGCDLTEEYVVINREE